ncbi:MAG: prevent-host-death family protein [Muribaculaceae bacterium]|nr:prevent-host-death family protein [Muribaculaceae bacterium]MDE6795201.1 prevent-host-death family protein [Muribaculaceae bacterium]
MIIVTSNDFTAEQSKYLSLAKAGEKILLKAKDGLFRILPTHLSDDTIVNDRFAEDFKMAMSEVKNDLNGTKPLKDVSSLWDEL